MNNNTEMLPAVVAPSARIGLYTLLGVVAERSREPSEVLSVSQNPVVVEDNANIKNYVCVGEGSIVSNGAFLDDFTRIGYGCAVGEGSRIMYKAFIGDRAIIGRHARIAGFVCDAAKVGDYSTSMGQLVHQYNKPHLDWWEYDEPSPVIDHHSVVGKSALVIGGVTVGPYAYVAAGAIITSDVPSWHVAVGVNRFIPWEEWSSSSLIELFEYWRACSK